jgi:hypothetical protein
MMTRLYGPGKHQLLRAIRHRWRCEVAKEKAPNTTPLEATGLLPQLRLVETGRPGTGTGWQFSSTDTSAAPTGQSPMCWSSPKKRI